MRRIVGTRTIDDGSTMGRTYYVDNYGQYWEPHSGGSTLGTGQTLMTRGPNGALSYTIESKPKTKNKE